MNWIVKDKGFYRSLLLIALPVAMQNIISHGVNLMDTVMIGRIGDISLAASSVSNQYYFIMGVMIFGIASGSNVLSAQYWGKGDRETVKKVFSIAQKATIILALITTGLALFLPELVLSVFTNDPAVIAEGKKYLTIVCFSYIFYGLSSCTMMMFRSVGTVKISVVVSAITLITNVFLNWVLIFGNLGAPALAIKGAALATLIARIIEFFIVIGYTFFKDKSLEYKFKDFLGYDKVLGKDFIKNVLPIILNELLWSVGASMLTIIVGRLSTDFLAANSIVGVISQVVMVGVFGVSHATAAVIGNKIGEGDVEKVQTMARTVMLLSLGLGLVAGLMLLILRPFVLVFYSNLEEGTLEFISTLLVMLSVITVFQSVTITNMMGVLRGGGDAKFVLICDVVFMWLICIPMGYIGAFHLGWSVPMVYLAIKSDEIFKTLLCTYRILGGKWVTNVTR